MSGKQHCFQFVCCNLGVEIILREIVNWGFSVHFVLLGVSWKFHLHFTLPYALAKIIQNGTKFIQQLNPGFKNHRNLDNFRFAIYNCLGRHWFSCEIDFLTFPSHLVFEICMTLRAFFTFQLIHLHQCKYLTHLILLFHFCAHYN